MINMDENTKNIEPLLVLDDGTPRITATEDGRFMPTFVMVESSTTKDFAGKALGVSIVGQLLGVLAGWLTNILVQLAKSNHETLDISTKNEVGGLDVHEVNDPTTNN